MRRLLCLIFGLTFCITAFAHTIEWYVDGTLYHTTTCASGDNITPPTPPAKTGYHFDSWAVRLPAGYTELEYLQGSGSTRIVPGVTINSNLTVDIKYETLTAGWLLGATAGASGRWGVTSNGTFYSGISGVADISSAILSGPNTAIFNYKTGATVNGVNIPFDTEQTYGDITYLSFYLFTADGTSVSSQEHKIYYTKIYDNGTLIRDLIPAKRNSDNVLGMYDTVSGTFFTNAGTGVFIAGPVAQ